MILKILYSIVFMFLGNGLLANSYQFNQSNNYFNQTHIAIPLPVVNRQLQISLLILILSLAVVFNGSVIFNISKDSLKLRMVHFLLIRHVCITDFLGACFVLPIPIIAMAEGTWTYGNGVCSIVSTSTATLWTMHLVAVAFYRADRVFAVWLPTGRYPLFTINQTNALLVLTWLIALSCCLAATKLFGHTFQPALALCIPNVPLVFFVLVFSGYCTGLVALTTGYVLAFALKRRRRKKRKIYNNVVVTEEPSDPQPAETEEKLFKKSSTSLTFSSENSSQNSSIVKITHSCTDLPQQTIAKATPRYSKSLDDLPSRIRPKFIRNFKPNGKTLRKSPDATRRAMASYAVSLGHLFLYLPAMFVIGLKGAQLPPGIALICGLVVYCEFLVQPIALLVVSPRLRKEIFRQVKRVLKI